MGKNAHRNVTVLTIAEELKLSATTVSCVLNGYAKQRRICEETADKVMAAAMRLGYVPNRLARSLRRQRSRVIGVVFADFMQGWAQRVHDGLISVLDAEDYQTFLSAHLWNSEREARELWTMMEHRVDGIICCIPMEESRANYARVLRQDLPLVFLGDTIDSFPAASFVAWDSGEAARLAVRHLIETGRRRIAFIGSAHPTRMTRARFEAYQSALAEAGLSVQEEWVIWEPVSEAAYPVDEYVGRMLRRLLASGRPAPDAIFALNDALAVTALALLDRMGYRVPQDIALIGMGNTPEAANPRISLSTMREPMVEMGRLAAQTMLELLDHAPRAPIQHLVTCNELIVRDSTRPLAHGVN